MIYGSYRPYSQGSDERELAILMFYDNGENDYCSISIFVAIAITTFIPIPVVITISTSVFSSSPPHFAIKKYQITPFLIFFFIFLFLQFRFKIRSEKPYREYGILPPV